MEKVKFFVTKPASFVTMCRLGNSEAVKLTDVLRKCAEQWGADFPIRVMARKAPGETTLYPLPSPVDDAEGYYPIKDYLAC